MIAGVGSGTQPHMLADDINGAPSHIVNWGRHVPCKQANELMCQTNLQYPNFSQMLIVLV